MEVLPLAMAVGKLYWWWCVYFLIFNLLIELSCSHLLSFSLSSNSNGTDSCAFSGKHRLYSYIRVYFLTILTLYLGLIIWQVLWVKLPLVKEAGMLYWWWFVYFFIFNLLIEISSHLLTVSLSSSNSNGVESCYKAGKHWLYSYIRVYLLTSTKS